MMPKLLPTVDCISLVSGCCTHPQVEHSSWTPKTCYSCKLRDSSPRIRRAPPNLDAAVVIISHNYGEFLQEAIDSVRGQTIRPSEIVIVADACTDDTIEIASRNGISCIPHESRNVTESRRLGYLETTAPVLCFLDADDILPQSYIQEGMRCFSEHRVGIVHSDMSLFGEETCWRKYPTEVTINDIEHHNLIHAGSLVRREALVSSLAFDSIPDRSVQDDWWLWRRVLSHGWLARKSTATYQYRRHRHNSSLKRIRQPYYDLAGLAYETITLVIPFSGRVDLLPDMLTWLEQQTWDRNQMQLLLLDGSDSTEFYSSLREWIDACGYGDIRMVRSCFGRPGLADDKREDRDIQREVQIAVAQLYSWVRTQVTSRFVMILEDDVLPPIDAIERLLRGFDSGIDSVSGVIPSRYHPGPIAWEKPGKIASPGQGLQPIGGNGFGCVMLRNSALQQQAISFSPEYPNYDQGFYARLGAGRARIDWDLVCEHRNSNSKLPSI